MELEDDLILSLCADCKVLLWLQVRNGHRCLEYSASFPRISCCFAVSCGPKLFRRLVHLPGGSYVGYVLPLIALKQDLQTLVTCPAF